MKISECHGDVIMRCDTKTSLVAAFCARCNFGAMVDLDSALQ